MPQSKYESLKAQFDEACKSNTVQEFIKVIKAKNVRSYITYFFLGCAYDFTAQTDKAHEHYLLAIQLIAPKDKNAIDMVKVVYQFIQKTGRTDLNDIIVKRALPGAKVIKKQTPNEPKTTPQPKVATPKAIPQPKSTTPSQPKVTPSLPKISPEQAFEDGKLAFHNNDLNKALEILGYAYKDGIQSVQCILMLAQTLQRLQRYEEAIFYLNKGIKLYQETDDSILFLTLKAQIYSSQKQWAESVKAYEALLKVTKEGSGRRRNTYGQIINIYRWYLEQPKKVDTFLKRLLKEFPEDPHVLKLQADIQSELQPPTPNPSVTKISEETPLITPMQDKPPIPLLQIPQNEDDKNRALQSIGDEIEDIILAINETCKNHEIEMIFAPTYLDSRIYRFLKIPAKNREGFTLFALNIYLLIFERTTQKVNGYPQKLGLLPFEFQRKHLFVREVDAIRHAYGDAHITDSDIWQPPPDSITVGKVLERYFGSKKSPHDSQFIDLQYGLLNSLKDYLNDLHHHIAQTI